MENAVETTRNVKVVKKSLLAFGILVGVLSVGFSAMSYDEFDKIYKGCMGGSKAECQALIYNGLPSAEQCDKDICGIIGSIYSLVGHHKEAIPYFEKAIALGNSRVYILLGNAYYETQDFFNAKKYFEIGCNNSVDAKLGFCYNLAVMYYEGKGVRQDYHKAKELYDKSCKLKHARACFNLGVLHNNGQGVKQNLSTAKQYFGKACDFGEQIGCDNYRELNERGIK